MTSFYMFRLLWLTFLTPSRMSLDAEHHVHESPLSMTGVLVILAVLSAVGGFFCIPHFLEPCCRWRRRRRASSTTRRRCSSLSVVIALTGLAGAVFVYGSGLARADALAARFPRLHRAARPASTSSTSCTRPCSAGRCYWISDRVFLGLGDRFLIDGSLNGIAAVGAARRRAAQRVETGNLQFYLALAVSPARSPASAGCCAMADATVLNLVLWLPVAGMLAIAPCRAAATAGAGISLGLMLLQFVLAAWLYARFDPTQPGLQFATSMPWIRDWGIGYRIGLDGYNVLLVVLTAFLGPLVVAGAFSAIQKD